MNENSFMNSVLGDGMVDQKDGSTTHIQSTAQAQGEISLRKYKMNFLIQYHCRMTNIIVQKNFLHR